MFDVFKRFGRKATLSYKALFASISWQQYLMCNLSSPLMQMLCFTLVAKFVYGDADLSKWFIGNALVMIYYNAVFGVGVQLSSEKYSGTLKLLVASPSSRMGIFLPRAFLHIFDGMFTIFVGLLVGKAIFSFSLPISVWPQFALTLWVASFSAMAFGLVISCIGLVSKDLNLILNVASMALLGLTGANFPIDRLPNVVQMVSQCMPLTRSIEICRHLSVGIPLSSMSGLLLEEFLIGVGVLIIGFVLFRVMERTAIKHGVLEIF